MQNMNKHLSQSKVTLLKLNLITLQQSNSARGLFSFINNFVCKTLKRARAIQIANKKTFLTYCIIFVKKEEYYNKESSRGFDN